MLSFRLLTQNLLNTKRKESWVSDGQSLAHISICLLQEREKGKKVILLELFQVMVPSPSVDNVYTSRVAWMCARRIKIKIGLST